VKLVPAFIWAPILKKWPMMVIPRPRKYRKNEIESGTGRKVSKKYSIKLAEIARVY
jgi:hypothetical protein